MALYSWSQTAAADSTADATINWSEGQAPSTVNDSARAMMAAIAKWRDDNAGSLTTGGTLSAYTLTSNQGFSTLAAMNGQTVRAKMNVTNGATPTLNVDALGAKPIVYATSVAVGTGDLIINRAYSFVYDNANGQWIVLSPGSGQIPAGTLMLFQQTAAPTGWTKQASFNNIGIRVVSGTAGSGGSSLFTTVFGARTISQANLPNYTLPNTLGISDPGHSHSLTTAFVQGGGTAAGGNNNGGTQSSANTSTTTTGITLTGSVTSGGSGATMDFDLGYVDVIIAQKN